MASERRLNINIFRLDQQKYYWGQLAFVLGSVVFATALSAWMFIVFGKGTGPLVQVQVMVFIVILFCSVIQCWSAVTNTRQDYLRDKWFMKEDFRQGAEAGYVPNPWRLILPRTLIAGIPLAALASLIVPRLGEEPFHLLNICFMAGIPLYALSSVLIMTILPRDQEAFAAVAARKDFAAVPFRKYIFMEHILPWLFIQGTINFGVGLMQFHHAADKAEGYVPINIVALDSGFVFALIAFLSWISSQVQVRPDVNIGRIPEDQRKAPSVPLMLALLALCNLFGVPVWLLLYNFSGMEISPLPAAIIKAVVVMLGVVLGCTLGVWWGRRRETALIRSKEIEEELKT